MRLTIASAAILVTTISSVVRAQLTYMTQSRSISATAGFINPSQTVSATDFGIFDRTLEITGPNPDNQPDSIGFAFQHSELNPDSIVMYGRIGGTDNYPYAGVGSGTGRSVLHTSFAVGQALAFAINASESVNPRPATSWQVRLTRDAQTIFDWGWALPGDPLTLNASASGTLDPGTYTLDASFFDGWVGQSAGTRFSDYSVALNVPEPRMMLVLIGSVMLLPIRWR